MALGFIKEYSSLMKNILYPKHAGSMGNLIGMAYPENKERVNDRFRFKQDASFI